MREDIITDDHCESLGHFMKEKTFLRRTNGLTALLRKLESVSCVRESNILLHLDEKISAFLEAEKNPLSGDSSESIQTLRKIIIDLKQAKQIVLKFLVAAHSQKMINITAKRNPYLKLDARSAQSGPSEWHFAHPRSSNAGNILITNKDVNHSHIVLSPTERSWPDTNGGTTLTPGETKKVLKSVLDFIELIDKRVAENEVKAGALESSLAVARTVPPLETDQN